MYELNINLGSILVDSQILTVKSIDSTNALERYRKTLREMGL